MRPGGVCFGLSARDGKECAGRIGWTRFTDFTGATGLVGRVFGVSAGIVLEATGAGLVDFLRGGTAVRCARTTVEAFARTPGAAGFGTTCAGACER